MRTRKEAEQIYMRTREVLKAESSVALATVISIEGSTYRRPGARLLIETDGTLTGNVSGGCLEQDVREVGLRVLKSGRSESIHYETGSDEDVLWGMGMGCDGRMDLFVEKLQAPSAAVNALCECFESDQACVLIQSAVAGGSSNAVVMRDGDIIAGQLPPQWHDALLAEVKDLTPESGKRLCEWSDDRFFVDVMGVAPSLVMCGAGDDAIPLARYAVDMGFRVTVVDHRPAYLTEDRFPRPTRRLQLRAEDASGRIHTGEVTFVIIKTRSLVHDEAWLRFFATTEVPYIGLLGPRSRRDKLMADLSDLQKERVYGPVGLDIGAEMPEQVAVSIVAELLAVGTGRSGGHLKEQKRAIHDT